ncbi:57_t:CDS:1 [Cetraspora pellucida]|uniref:57_t:CDS:1 n=1 Tax=Cetraspora pellucida TaxID=1433469 RepID=A0A9N9GI11_9GLOM|nr:57_t:CDS:1 [Cetraspora pellucida]
MICTLTLTSPLPKHSIIGESTVSKHTIYFATCGEEYHVIYSGLYVKFEIPDLEYIKQLNDESKSTPNLFILFRSKLQQCISALGLNTEWVFMSEISKKLWADIKKNDQKLVSSIRNVYKVSSVRKKSRIRFKPYDYKPKNFDKSNGSEQNPEFSSTESLHMNEHVSVVTHSNLINSQNEPLKLLLRELFEIY